MAGLGAGYDLSVSTFSPDGRVFQVEYAQKAVDNSSASIGFSCVDGVVLAAQKLVGNQPLLLHHRTNRKIYAINKFIAVSISGFLADGRQLVARARYEAEHYYKVFGADISTKVLAQRLGLYLHAYTLYWSVRPFGASLIIAGIVNLDQKKKKKNNNNNDTSDKSEDKKMGEVDQQDADGEIYCIDPSGVCYEYSAAAIGKNKQNIKTELEKLCDKKKNMTCRECMKEVTRILYTVHEEEKKMEVELGWIAKETDWQYQSVSEELTKDIVREVQNRMEQE